MTGEGAGETEGDAGPSTALEALSEAGLASHVADAVVHDLDLVGWEVRPQVRQPDMSTVKEAALAALGRYTGVSDPERPWWNLNMPKALDIMLPAICEALTAARGIQ